MEPMYLSIQQKETGKQIKKLLKENGYTVKDVQNAMGFENHQKLRGTVEVDEYHSGGSLKNMHLDKKLAAKKIPNQNKKLLQGFLERVHFFQIKVLRTSVQIKYLSFHFL